MATNGLSRQSGQLVESTADPWPRRLRETIVGAIALIVAIGFVVMTGLAFFYASDNETFGRAKDLLLFVSPVVGVIIGFYFNKASMEARTENAEEAARAASDNAQQAVQERAEATAQATQATQVATQAVQAHQQAAQQAEQATQQAAQAKQQADQAVSLLGIVAESAQAVIAQHQPADTEAANAARKRLQDALEKVRRSALLELR